MKTYPIGLVPGPVSVPQDIRDIYTINFGSADLEDDFFETYDEAGNLLKEVLSTKNDVVIMSGEGVLALWGGIKKHVALGQQGACRLKWGIWLRRSRHGKGLGV